VGFEIDGNCQVNTAGNLDWQSAAVGTQPVGRDGLGDSTQYTSGGSEANWPNWFQGSGTASGQSDINDVYAFTTKDPSTGDIWEMIGFSRAGSTGSIGYTVEVNQDPNRSNAPAIPNRSTGDWRFNLTQNGNNPLSLAACQTWTSTGPSSGTWTSRTCPPTYAAATSSDGLFLEAALNMTVLTDQQPGCSFVDNFSVINLRSRQSSSFSSAIKDYVAPLRVAPPDTCLERAMTTSASSAALGGSLSDTATVTATGGGPTPTGTVTFQLFGPSATADCSGDPVFTATDVALVNGQATSPPFTPTEAGSYHWVVVYSGDVNYLGLISGCGASGETSTLNKGEPTITTNASDATLPNAISTDSATVVGVVGGPTPSGTMTFTAYGPTASSTPVCDTVAFTSAPLALIETSPGTAISAAAFLPTAAGNYFWRVSYSGDSNYSAVTTPCGADNEMSVVSKASPTMTTSATSAMPGQQIMDIAVLTDFQSAIMGTVTFRLYGPFPDTTAPDCTDANLAFTSADRPIAETRAGTARAISEPFTVPAAALGMRYFWVASYTGDDNNNAVTSGCGDDGETSLVRGTVPTIATTGSGPVTLGDPITDQASVTGPAGDPTPTGTVQFFAFAPSDTGCEGDPVFTSADVTLDASGNATSAPPFIPLEVGTYRWVVTYSGDDNYISLISDCNADGESSVVNKATPSVSTQATTVVLGSSPQDAATLIGVAGVPGLPAPTGTATFTAYGPSPTPDCTGTPAFGPVTEELTPIDDTGTSAATASFTPPPVAGSYYWVVSYSGDDNYNEVLADPATACGINGETSTVTPALPTITTAATSASLPNASVFDTATVTGVADAPTPTGTVTFRLFGPSATPDCTGTAPFGPATVPLVDGTATSPAFQPTVAGNYYWLVDYSGDSNYQPVSSLCGDPDEISPVTQSAISLTSSATGTTLGGQITDTATLVGVDSVTPTGTVTVTVYGPTTSAEPVCDTQAFQQADVPLQESTPGTATATVSFTPTLAGHYFWRIDYPGDANYSGTTSDCGALDEESTVKSAPSITTAATASVVLPGNSIRDTATLSAFTSPVTGTVTFTLFGPSATPDCSGTPVFTTLDAPIAADGTATSASFTPTKAGNYYWIASYSGDADNAAVMSDCGDGGETSAVAKAAPTLTTQATADASSNPAGDTAELHGFQAPATGTVTFQLFGPSPTPVCTAQVFAQTVPIAEDGTATSPQVTPPKPGTYYWIASYSGDANNDPASTACGENGETTIVTGEPTVAKKIVSVAAGSQPGSWTVTYTVTVANPHDFQLSYSLTDTLGYPATVTVTSTSASRVHSALDGSGATTPEPIPSWTGTGAGTSLATDRPLPATSKDTYTLVVAATVGADIPAGDLECNGTPGHGWFNSATMTAGTDPTVDACDPITPPTTPTTPTTPPTATTPTTPTTTTTPTTPTTPAPPTTPPSPPLSNTGVPVAQWAIDAALLIGAGALLLLFARPRRRQHHG
jgi:hypothetical protein